MIEVSDRRAIFLDRDGVINIDSGYVGRAQDFIFVDGAVDALVRLAAAGYLLVVVTNQSGIARGFYSESDFAAVTRHMCNILAAAGAPIARVEHCPHLPEDQQITVGVVCTCRKPKPGMLLAAAAVLGINLPNSVMIGDKLDDIVAGRRAGAGRCFLVGAGRDVVSPLSDGNFADLATCVDGLLGSALTG